MKKALAFAKAFGERLTYRVPVVAGLSLLLVSPAMTATATTAPTSPRTNMGGPGGAPAGVTGGFEPVAGGGEGSPAKTVDEMAINAANNADVNLMRFLLRGEPICHAHLTTKTFAINTTVQIARRVCVAYTFNSD